VRFAGRLALLTALWLLAWGQLSLANVVSGVAVAAALLVAFPPSRARPAPVRVDVLAVGRLAGHIAVQLVTSNIVMTREVLRPRSTIRPGVLAHRLQRPSEHVVTLMTSVIALSPGTMTVDVDRTSSTIYVHFLFLRDVAAARASLGHLERLAAAAVTAGAGTETPGAT
jgi:multicomponent Na+:H+ antiporter subunit E